MDVKQLSGRLLVLDPPTTYTKAIPALYKLDKHQFCCRRCQMVNDWRIYSLPGDDFYCPACLSLGRLTNHNYLIAIAEQNQFPAIQQPLTWTGQLTAAQTVISQKLCKIEQAKQDHLVWAVTGSGKTEMLFQVLRQAVMKKERIAWIAPRVDVCNEIYPRLQAAFQPVSLALLHGQGASQYYYSQILVCTVHQLLKFYQAFDLIVLDECDSYPYVNNLMLHNAVKNALKPQHSLISLSATPSLEYLQLIKHQKLSYSLLSRRFHGHDLPEPQYCWVNHSSTQQLHWRLKRQIHELLENRQRFLLFVDSIRQAEQLSQLLQQTYPDLQQTYVHAKDAMRQNKVQQFRAGQWQALVTTTVLERGVTFDNIDVLVWQADSKRFTQQALVQIAGRAGRSRSHPDNQVWFFGTHYTTNIAQAIHQIRRLNYA